MSMCNNCQSEAGGKANFCVFCGTELPCSDLPPKPGDVKLGEYNVIFGQIGGRDFSCSDDAHAKMNVAHQVLARKNPELFARLSKGKIPTFCAWCGAVLSH